MLSAGTKLGPYEIVAPLGAGGMVTQTLRATCTPLRGSQIDAEPFDSLKALARLQLPALVIVGKADFLTPPAFAEEMHQALTHSRLVVLEHSAHMGHLEEPQAFTAAIRDFVSAQR